jgi:hypothetical protein
MRFRPAVLAAALIVGVAAPGGVSAQGAPDDGVVRLLGRLEQIVQRSDLAAYRELLTPSANRARAEIFVEAEMVPSMTRAVMQERERIGFKGTPAGQAYRVAVDVFQEYGDRGRIASWWFDVERAADGGSPDDWLIADQERLSSVENLYRLSLASTKQFRVSNLRLVDEDLALVLSDGSLFVADIDLGTTAMVFLGSGQMTFRPSPDREKTQVRILSGSDTLDTRFDSMYLRINPADFAALVSREQLVAVAVDQEEFRRADRIFREQSAKSYNLELGDLSRDNWSLLPEPGDLVAEIQTRRFDMLTYSRASSLHEDISLFDRRRRKTVALYASALNDPDPPGPGSLQDAPFDVRHYDIDVSATPDRRWIEGTARLHVVVGARALDTLSLRLAEPLVVQSVVSDVYGRLFSMRVRDQGTLIVNLPESVPSGSEMGLTITYAGRLDPQPIDAETVRSAQFEQPALDSPDLLAQPEPSFLYSSQVNWYPRPAASHYATGVLRITVPSGLSCVASGEPDPVTPAEDGDAVATAQTTFVFNALRPLRYFAFVVSRLIPAERLEVRFEPVAANSNATDADVPDALVLSVTTNPGHRNRGRVVAERAAAIARFYHSLTGDVPFPSLTVALVESTFPGGHSPGYFAMLNEPPPPAAFYRRRNDPAWFNNFPDFFLAHEIAHQWWGQAVGWRNYHEQWLSEGFAQYFAALYAARATGESGAPSRQDGVFREALRQMRRWAADESDQGPVWLGSRLGHLQGDSRVFRALVYNKGALVLHMLRQLVGDDTFFRGIRRFYEDSRFQSVGTADFQAAMEAEADRSLARFFERWIYGSTLPTLSFGYHVESNEVVIHVEQVGELFDLPLVVTLRYADGTSSDVVVPVTAQTVESRVPLTGQLRSAEVSREEPPLAEIVRN